MKVCASYGVPDTGTERYDFSELRMDVFGEVPETDDNTIIAMCGRPVSAIPDGFCGIVDNGMHPAEGYRNIFSTHDFESTPECDRILKMLDADCEMRKGAFMARSFRDLHEIYGASKSIAGKHVLIGMGEFGKITRIRSDVLGNEFMYGYVGKPTAPGQLSAEELKGIGEGYEVTGIAGRGIQYTLSPAIHTAAMKAAGVRGAYLIFDTPELDCISDVMAEYEIRGLNVTIPHKTEIIAHLDSCSEDAAEIGAVNTIVNDGGRTVGYNTDCSGISDALGGAGDRVLVIGSGGSARAAVLSVMKKGCGAYVAARNAEKAGKVCRDLGSEMFSGKDVSKFDTVISCTPPLDAVGISKLIDLKSFRKNQKILDLAYMAESALSAEAKAAGCIVVCGKEVLVRQAAESFRLWFGKEPDIGAMRRATA